MENHKCSNSGAIKNNATQKENEHATVRTDELTQNTDETSALGGGHLCNNDLCLWKHYPRNGQGLIFSPQAKQ